MARRPLDVAIVGLGNWGTSLSAALEAAAIPLREVVMRKPRRSALPVAGCPVTSWKTASLNARVIWLCVPDSAIASVSSQIARQRANLTGQIVVHSSGALTIAALETVRRAGASVASVHPAMTFPTRDIVQLEGVFFGVETGHAPTRRLLHTVVRKLGGKPFNLQSRNKAMYHAAGTLASPLLVSALTAAMEAARLAGLDERTAQRWVQSLAEPTFRNVFSRGAANSFSGPFARGDAGTIHLHLKTLQPHPILAEVYRALAEHAIKSLPVRNSEALAAVLQAETGSKRTKPRRERTATR